MAKVAANLSMLFNEVPFLDRFEAAAKAGFKAVEFLFPYDNTIEEIGERLQKNHLKLVLHNLPSGNWVAGDRGIASHPDRVGEFQDGVGKAIQYAKALGVPQVNALSGPTLPGLSEEKQHATFVANLKFAAAALKAEGIRLVTEPVNTIDMKNAYLNRTQQAVDIIKEVGSDNLFIQYDIYHMQRMEGELANTIKANLPLIKHMQLADLPNRHEPGTGEINYHFLFNFLDEIGYDGYIGCEYRPATTTVEGLKWLKEYNVE